MTRPRLIDLPHGKQTIVDEQDYPLVKDLTLYVGTNGYVYFSTWNDGKSHPQTLHSYLMQTPKGMHTDHINGDKLDNRRENLRVVSPSINSANRTVPNRNNTSGVRGVHWRAADHCWHAQITVNRKNHYLGIYRELTDAIAARRAAEAEFWGKA